MPSDPTDNTAQSSDTKHRDKNKESLPDQTRPRSFYDVKGFLQQASELSGDINNQIVSAVTHHDLAQKFTQPVTVNLAKEYLAGRDLINARKAEGKAETDWSGLNKDELLCVKAYQQLHNNLPAQIPFVDRDGLLRSVERNLENKVKAADAQPHPRAEAKAPAAEIKQSTDKDVAVKTSQSRSNSNPADGPTKISQPADTRRAAPANNQESAPKSPPRPHTPEAKELKVDSSGSTAHKAASTPTEKMADRSVQNKGQDKSQDKSGLDKGQDKNIQDKSILDKNIQSKITQDKNISEKGVHDKGLSAGDVRKINDTAKKEIGTTRDIAPPHAAIKSESFKAAEKAHDLNRPNPIEKTKVAESSPLLKHDLIPSRFMPRSTTPPEWLPARYQTFIARSAETVVNPRSNTIRPDVPVMMRLTAPPQPFCILPVTFSPLAIRPGERQSTESKISPRSDSTNAVLPKNILTKTDSKQSPPVVGDNRTTVSKPQAAKTEIFSSVPVLVPVSQSKTFAVLKNNQILSVSHSIESPISQAGAGKRADHTSELSDLEKIPKNGRKSEAKRNKFEDDSDDEDEEVDQHGRPLTKTFIVRSFMPDRRYITGSELAFVAVMALASASRLRSAASVEQALDKSGRSYVLVEEEWPGPSYTFPEKRIGTDKKNQSDKQSGEQSDSAVNTDNKEFDKKHSIPANRQEKLPQARPQNQGRKTLFRPQILVQEGDNLTEIAEALFNDARFGNLIADLNILSSDQSEVDGVRIVRLISRQKLSLPVYQDLLDYERYLKSQGERTLITIVESSGIDRELLHEGLAPMLGINSSNRDPLQKDQS